MHSLFLLLLPCIRAVVTSLVHFQVDLNLPQTERGQRATGPAVRPSAPHRAENGDPQRGGGPRRRRGTGRARQVRATWIRLASRVLVSTTLCSISSYVHFTRSHFMFIRRGISTFKDVRFARSILRGKEHHTLIAYRSRSGKVRPQTCPFKHSNLLRFRSRFKSYSFWGHCLYSIEKEEKTSFTNLVFVLTQTRGQIIAIV